MKILGLTILLLTTLISIFFYVLDSASTSIATSVYIILNYSLFGIFTTIIISIFIIIFVLLLNKILNYIGFKISIFYNSLFLILTLALFILIIFFEPTLFYSVDTLSMLGLNLILFLLTIAIPYLSPKVCKKNNRKIISFIKRFPILILLYLNIVFALLILYFDTSFKIEATGVGIILEFLMLVVNGSFLVFIIALLPVLISLMSLMIYSYDSKNDN